MELPNAELPYGEFQTDRVYGLGIMKGKKEPLRDYKGSRTLESDRNALENSRVYGDTPRRTAVMANALDANVHRWSMLRYTECRKAHFCPKDNAELRRDRILENSAFCRSLPLSKSADKLWVVVSIVIIEKRHKVLHLVKWRQTKRNSRESVL